MDTRFWGPSGWRLLHLVSFAASTLPAEALHTFFETLPFVLPCKFCRASLTDYIAADPIPRRAEDYARWLYRVHNRVNAKLREQKLLDAKDPSWNDVEKRYTEWLRAPCSAKQMVGWDFLFSVAYTTPCPQVASSPMPGAPPAEALPTPELRNRWGVISRNERLPYIATWWATLPRVLPFAEWRAAWARVVPAPPALEEGRRAVTAWLYAAERAMCPALRVETPHNSFAGLCSELTTYSSGCGKRKIRVKTCRATQARARQTLRKRRRTQYRATGGFL
jgi:hypothetical protein